MFLKKDIEKFAFGYNDNVWIDNFGIYPNNSNFKFLYENNETLLNKPKPYEMDDYHKNFSRLYKELDFWQINFRLQE